MSQVISSRFYGYGIQLIGLIFLVVQSFFIPIYIGMGEYGVGLQKILPILLVSSIFETLSIIFIENKNSFINSFFSIFFLSLMVVFFLILVDGGDYLFLFLFALFFLTNIYLKSFNYYFGGVGLIFFIETISFVFFIISCFVMFVIEVNNYYFYLISFFVFTLSSLFFNLINVFMYLRRNRLEFFVLTYDLYVKAVLSSISVKSNHIFVNIVFLYFVGLLGGVSLLAQTKFIFSVLGMVKFLIPFNLNIFEKEFREFGGDFAFRLINKILIRVFLLSLFLFSIFYIDMLYLGFLFELFGFYVGLDFIYYFFAYPFVLVSPFYGLFFHKLNKLTIFFSLSFASLLLVFLLGFAGLQIEISFFISYLILMVSIIMLTYRLKNLSQTGY